MQPLAIIWADLLTFLDYLEYIAAIACIANGRRSHARLALCVVRHLPHKDARLEGRNPTRLVQAHMPSNAHPLVLFDMPSAALPARAKFLKELSMATHHLDSILQQSSVKPTEMRASHDSVCAVAFTHKDECHHMCRLSAC